jgi:hypothetical protein
MIARLCTGFDEGSPLSRRLHRHGKAHTATCRDSARTISSAAASTLLRTVPAAAAATTVMALRSRRAGERVVVLEPSRRADRNEDDDAGGDGRGDDHGEVGRRGWRQRGRRGRQRRRRGRRRRGWRAADLDLLEHACEGRCGQDGELGWGEVRSESGRRRLGRSNALAQPVTHQSCDSGICDDDVGEHTYRPGEHLDSHVVGVHGRPRCRRPRCTRHPDGCCAALYAVGRF